MILRIKIGIGALLCVLLIYGIYTLFLRESWNRLKCASNLSAIGQCILLYSNGHHGSFPPDLGTLAYEEDIAPLVFICPDSDTSQPSDLKPNQLVAWVNEHSDYIYASNGLANGIDPTKASQIVLAYEKDENHYGKGMNVLFADGIVRWMTIDEAHHAIELSGANKASRAQTSPSGQ